MKPLPRTRSCFVCGQANPLGLNLAFSTDGREVTGRFTPRPEHAGFQNTLHGGLIATVLDEVMVWACGVGAGRLAYCAELNVRFQLPARPGLELVVSGALANNRRNRLFEAKAELRDPDGRLLASATGKYLPVPDPVVEELQADLVGNLDDVLRPVRESGRPDREDPAHG